MTDRATSDVPGSSPLQRAGPGPQRGEPAAAATTWRILVLLDPAAGAVEKVRALLEGDATEIFVVTPILPTRLAWLTNDDADASAAAGHNLDDALGEAAGAGVPAGGATGSDDDLLTVIGDALAHFPADEIVIATRPERKRHWRVDHLAAKVGERHGLPVRALVTTLSGQP